MDPSQHSQHPTTSTFPFLPVVPDLPPPPCCLRNNYRDRPWIVTSCFLGVDGSFKNIDPPVPHDVFACFCWLSNQFNGFVPSILGMTSNSIGLSVLNIGLAATNGESGVWRHAIEALSGSSRFIGWYFSGMVRMCKNELWIENRHSSLPPAFFGWFSYDVSYLGTLEPKRAKRKSGNCTGQTGIGSQVNGHSWYE